MFAAVNGCEEAVIRRGRAIQGKDSLCFVAGPGAMRAAGYLAVGR